MRASITPSPTRPQATRMSCMTSFAGKIALVTGASGGIGLATARALARGGARVVAHYYAHREPLEALSRQLPEGVLQPAQADLRDFRAATALVAEAAAGLGGLHILVNNAGAIRDNLLATAEEA